MTTHRWAIHGLLLLLGCARTSVPAATGSVTTEEPADPFAVLHDRRPLDLALTAHVGELPTTIVLDASGLPYRHGRISLNFYRRGPGGAKLMHTESRSYTPAAATAKFTVTIPRTVPSGEYHIDASLVLYDASGEQLPVQTRTLLLNIESDEASVAATEPAERASLELTDYRLNQAAPSSDHRSRLNVFLGSLRGRLVDAVTITAHTCDLGTPATNEMMGRRRAEAIAAIVSEYFPGILATISLIPHHQTSATDPQAQETERIGFRRVEIHLALRRKARP